MEDTTLQVTFILRSIADKLGKDFTISKKLITLGEFKFDYSCYRLDEALLEILPYIGAYYRDELYPNIQEQKKCAHCKK